MKKVLQLLSYIGITALASCNSDNNTSTSTPSPIKNKVLFICGGNTGRSPMAQYLGNNYFHFSANGYIADSRGVNVNLDELSPEPNAVSAMIQLDINMESHIARSVTREDIESAKIVLAMTAAHKQKLQAIAPAARNIYMLSECAIGRSIDVEDAYGKNLAIYVNTRNTIAKYIMAIQKNGMQCINAPT